MRYRNVIAVALASAFVGSQAPAHHSANAYDFESPAVLSGTVTDYEWRNPHVYIYLDIEGDDGELRNWTIEGFPPALMRRSGWTSDTLGPGAEVSLQVFSARDTASATAMLGPAQSAEGVLVDTRSYFDAAVDAAATGTASSIFGNWAGVRAPDAMNADTWPLTDRGREALTAFTDAESPSASCIPGPAPGAMVFPDFKQIEDIVNTIVIRAEFDNMERVVYMEGDLPGDPVDSIQGYSRGRWEGDALVVETNQFTEHRSGNGYGIPSGTDKRLIERFSLNESGDSLTYSFELTDPEYFTEPVIREMQWVYRPDVEYSVLPCDLANAQRFLAE